MLPGPTTSDRARRAAQLESLGTTWDRRVLMLRILPPWMRAALASFAGTGRRRARSNRRRLSGWRPVLEVLEDRTVPSAFRPHTLHPHGSPHHHRPDPATATFDTGQPYANL